ncbi:hypothetical protein NRS6094_04354 [Bacillus subtilis]|uniref:hypothetical protein n=1 Tax=Bacillus subtilis TaxID=1423 RepID=UPI001B9B9461|nr:hypothetical protein [Bacillus subtilis]CAF1778371.1 hypothetical protein NRS6094_04354 [Bacillus subtilis]
MAFGKHGFQSMEKKKQERGFEMKSYRKVAFSQSAFDQWRLNQAGGTITIPPSGNPFFDFKTKAQYEKYLQLNSERGNWA